MNNDDPNAGGQTPKLSMPEQMHFERGPVKCPGCKREFKYFVIEVIENMKQLRCGSVLLPKAELVCMNCGAIFYWNLREKDLVKMTETYSELSRKLPSYRPGDL